MNLELVNLAVSLLVLVGVSYLVYRKVHGFNARSSSAVYVDTSVLIDGRIVDIVATGFMPGDLVIPRSVIRELQLLADGTDHAKREKARRGLDVVHHLQESSDINVEILADGLAIPEGVDERLLKLAKKNGGKVLTIDYNLNKVAQVEGVTVLNINDLAKQLRMSFLPGDHLSLELTQIGSNAKQAVGYLEDGTMVVVEQAKQKLGQTVRIEITRSLQTSAGRMMFARLSETKTHEAAAAQPVQSKLERTAARPVRSARRESDNATQSKPSATSPKNSRSTQHRPQSRRRATNHEDALVQLANNDTASHSATAPTRRSR